MGWFARLFGRRDHSAVADDWGDAADTVPFDTSGWKSSPQSALPAEAPHFSWYANGFGARTINGGGDQRLSWIRSTFAPAQPVSEIRKFAGRADLLKRVIRALEHQNLHVVLYGDRGIGKTSMLRVVNELASAANYLVHYSSCGEQSEFSSTFRAAAADIPLLYCGDVDPAQGDVESGATFADRLPAADFSVAQFSDLLGKLSGTRALIILDEFDRASSPHFRNAIAELIKNLSDRSIKVQLLIAGVASNFTDLVAHVPSIRRNIVGINVPNMTDDEVRDLVAIATQNIALKFDEGAVAALVKASGGLPYLASLLGQHGILAAVEADAAQVSVSHVEQARLNAAEEILSRLSAHSQFALEQPGMMTANSLLRRSAAAAVKNGGMISDAKLTAELAKLSPPVAGLVQAVAGDPRGSWQFVEDGVSSYLWLA